jgi:hypothetical protein
MVQFREFDPKTSARRLTPQLVQFSLLRLVGV